MTKYSFEVPLAHLADFDDLQDFHFSLSFLYKDKRYAEFMTRTTKELWIDNSANELRQPDSTSNLVNLFTHFNAVKVVAPDDPDWGPERTLRQFSVMAELGVKPEHIIVIIHHPDWIGHYRSYGITNFAVPYDFRYCTDAKLKRFGQAHFLGLVSIREIQIVNPPSCDTSIPIKLALANMTLDEWVRTGCKHIHTVPSFFDIKMTKNQINIARYNIERLKEVDKTGDPVNHPLHYTKGRIEALDFILDQDLPYLPSTILKYLVRYRFKDSPVEDLKKARFYLDRLIYELEGGKP